MYETHFDGFIYLAETGLVADDLPVRQWTQADARFRGFEGELITHVIDNDTGKLDLRLFGDNVRARAGRRQQPAAHRSVAHRRGSADGTAKPGALRSARVRYATQDDVAVGETATAGYTLVDAHFAYHRDNERYGWELFLDGKQPHRRSRARAHFVPQGLGGDAGPRELPVGCGVFF